MAVVRQRLNDAAQSVAQDWWVPESYERLAELARRLLAEKKQAHELPILSRDHLRQELRASASTSLHAMADDPQLLKRGIEYLEAVGDMMTDSRLDVLLLDVCTRANRTCVTLPTTNAGCARAPISKIAARTSMSKSTLVLGGTNPGNPRSP